MFVTIYTELISWLLYSVTIYTELICWLLNLVTIYTEFVSWLLIIISDLILNAQSTATVYLFVRIFVQQITGKSFGHCL